MGLPRREDRGLVETFSNRGLIAVAAATLTAGLSSASAADAMSKDHMTHKGSTMDKDHMKKDAMSK